MNQSKRPNAHSYHPAILSEMGIPSWVMRTQSTEQPKETESAPAKPSLAASDAIARLRQIAPKPEAKPASRIKDQVVLSFLSEQPISVLVTDVLMALGLEQSQKTADKEQGACSRFVWETGDDIRLTGNHLITPSPRSVWTAAQKRQLWQLLSQFDVPSAD